MKGRQSFISAPWIVFSLRRAPQRCRRKWALRVLSLSPHYFYRDAADYKGMPQAQFLEEEFKRNTGSRERICERALSPYLAKTDTVLDYGCGPGFFARCVSRRVRRVFAVDISTGALECAKILNAAENVAYVTPAEMNRQVEDSAVDLVYSFAVIQHVTDSVFEDILENCRNKMKTGGTLLFHVMLSGALSEGEWRKDRSWYGRVKWHYGLNCFSRTEQEARHLVEKHGFRVRKVVNLRDVFEEVFDDICSQHLIVAEKI